MTSSPSVPNEGLINASSSSVFIDEYSGNKPLLQSTPPSVIPHPQQSSPDQIANTMKSSSTNSNISFYTNLNGETSHHSQYSPTVVAPTISFFSNISSELGSNSIPKEGNTDSVRYSAPYNYF